MGLRTYNGLLKEFNEKVKKLQKECPHKKKEWRDEYWALGYSTGKQVKVCMRCNLVLSKTRKY